ncbi:MAG: hypothetical protein AAF713_20540 [Pseudomonadota bacterium]
MPIVAELRVFEYRTERAEAAAEEAQARADVAQALAQTALDAIKKSEHDRLIRENKLLRRGLAVSLMTIGLIATAYWNQLAEFFNWPKVSADPMSALPIDDQD